MKILITGSTGLLGQALINQLARSCELVGASRHLPPSVEGAPHVVCDLTDADATHRLLRQIRPDLVIHTQALSDVDRCELEPALADAMNVQTMDHLCHALKSHQPRLIALSTDYVFDGGKASPYDETDEPKPLSIYGKTKLAAERLVLRYPNGYVVRPSTLFGPGRMNFCDAIVQRLQQGQPVDAFVDQTTSPTYTHDLACAMERLVRVMATRAIRDLPRVWHLTNAGGCSRVQFARRVAEWLGGPEALIRPVFMRDQHRPAPRPPYCVLGSRYASLVLEQTLRPWDEALHAYLQQRHWLN